MVEHLQAEHPSPEGTKNLNKSCCLVLVMINSFKWCWLAMSIAHLKELFYSNLMIGSRGKVLVDAKMKNWNQFNSWKMDFLATDINEKKSWPLKQRRVVLFSQKKIRFQKQKQKYFFKSTTFIWEDSVSNLVLETYHLVLSLVQSVLILLMPVFVFDLLFIIVKKDTMKNIKLCLNHIYALILRAKISQICHLGQEYFSDLWKFTLFRKLVHGV